MKTSRQVFLFFLVLTFSANFLLSSAQINVTTPVLDTTGQELRRGLSYNVLPADGGNGGVSLDSNRGAPCPFLITQAPFEENNGIPLGFSPINPNDTVIRLSTDLSINVTSNQTTSCPQSNVWMLNITESFPLFVTLGGVEGNLTSLFKIESYEGAYQIQYCPSSSSCPPGVFCSVLCGNVGILLSGGHRRLAFNQPQPLKIVFQRA